MTIHDFDMVRVFFEKEIKETLVDKAIGEARDIDTAVITAAYDYGSMAIIDNSRKATYG
jgi:myo-inositol 2-dehydrogenase/D-chiro-inositol 1-dehydrogenase